MQCTRTAFMIFITASCPTLCAGASPTPSSTFNLSCKARPGTTDTTMLGSPTPSHSPSQACRYTAALPLRLSHAFHSHSSPPVRPAQALSVFKTGLRFIFHTRHRHCAWKERSLLFLHRSRAQRSFVHGAASFGFLYGSCDVCCL